MANMTRPNVVFIVGDNVGWGDIGCYGGLAPTPRIDALAAEGMRFKNYNVEAQCTPTRSAILTGRLPIRTGNCSVPLPGQGDYGLAPWEYTLGELFSDAGYATAAFGKWHVGDIEGRLPTDQGFDEWFGIKNTSDESGLQLLPAVRRIRLSRCRRSGRAWQGSPVTPVEDFNLETRPLLDEKIAARTVDFIKRNAEAGTPFFTYVCFTQMHPPLIHHPDFTGKSRRRRLLGHAGRTRLPHRPGARRHRRRPASPRNTIVVWSSDNPAGRATVDGRLERTVARSLRIRLRRRHARPGMVRWPGKVEAGHGHRRDPHARSTGCRRSHRWSGRANGCPTDRPIDGVDASAFLLGQSDTTGRDHVIYFGSDAGVDVGEVEDHEGRVPLQREHERPDHEATVATDLRPHRRSGGGVGSGRGEAGRCVGRRAGRGTSSAR